MDFYNSIEECEKAHYNRQTSNSRYKFFKQKHFTAGDENQFLENKNENTNMKGDIPEINYQNVFNLNTDFHIWELYNDLQALDVLNTFRYIFYKFKKGIFVKIVSNQLKVFLPFSNVNFVNEWSEKINKGEMDFEIFKQVSENEGRVYQEKQINKYINTWFANNLLIRYEYPINETDTNIGNFKNFFEELCRTRQLPDIEFFINKRDFPILSKKLTEPYFHIWNSKTQPLVSHSYDKYLPILSMCKDDDYADLLIPTHEDWARVQSHKNKWFIHSYRSCVPKSIIDNMIDFDSKKPIAVFRGSSTGYGFTIKDNQRLKISYISSLQQKDSCDGLQYLDAGITKWNFRPKKMMNKQNLETLDNKSLPFDLVPILSYKEQSEFKYIIHIDGHVTAFRLSLNLSMNSVILMVQTNWKIWFSHLLIPYKHYIPVKSDCSDIIDQIKWCKANNDTCRQIARNARIFYETYLSEAGMLDYTQKLLIEIKKKVGNYQYISTPIFNYSQYISEYTFVPSFNFNQESKLQFSNQRRYGQLKGLQHFMKNHYIYTDKSIHFSNENVKLYKAKICDFNIALKQRFKHNLQHEVCVGLTINKVVKHIPNFIYTFGSDNENQIVTEFIDGIRFFDFICDPTKFDIHTYINILLQICLALHVAQYNILFTHNDLTPWNIILLSTKKECKIDYLLEDGQIFSVSTSIIPVIIDYDKSHVSIDFKHCGHNFSYVQDILSLLVTSIFQVIVCNKLDREAYSLILTLSNFISNTRYCPKRFRNFKQLKSFLMYKKKHSELIYSKKYELEKLTPLNLFFYIQEKCNSKTFLFSKSKTYNSYMNKSYYEQVYEYLSAKNRQEQLESFLNALQNVKKRSSSVDSINNAYYQNKFILKQRLINIDLTIFESPKSNNIISKEIVHKVKIKIPILNDKIFTFIQMDENIKYNKNLLEYYIQEIKSLPKEEDLSLLFSLYKKIRHLIAFDSIQYEMSFSSIIKNSTFINQTLCNVDFVKELSVS